MGQAPPHLDRAEFSRRYRARYADPRYATAEAAVAELEEIAWQSYEDRRKAPETREAGDEFADPRYRLSLDWLAARARLRDAAAHQASPTSGDRVLVVSGSSRNDGTCPSEIAKSYRLARLACDVLTGERSVEVDFLDLSLLSSEYGRQIYPCKGCVSTAMPMCHWPCSCYPHHSLGQVNDWMAEIYERFTRAHGVLLVTPVYWLGVPSGLKAMIDRLVCADGGNPDPTTTQGKDPVRAKQLERAGWSYPQHLEGRAYGLVVHGDVVGAEQVRRSLAEWLEGTGFIRAGAQASIDRYIGYYGLYADSHAALEADHAIQEEVRNVARAVATCVAQLRSGQRPADADLTVPRPK